MLDGYDLTIRQWYDVGNYWVGMVVVFLSSPGIIQGKGVDVGQCCPERRPANKTLCYSDCNLFYVWEIFYSVLSVSNLQVVGSEIKKDLVVVVLVTFCGLHEVTIIP